MSYTVYKHTSPSGKVYIGITKQNPIKRWKNGHGYKDHNPYFWNAIQKYEWNNFKHEILFTHLTKEEACQKEIELIAFYKSNNRSFGYNVSTGGESGSGVSMSEETRMKISQANKGRTPWTTGKSLSEDVKRKISEANKNKVKPRRPVICVTLNLYFNSAEEAGKYFGVTRKSISRYITGVRKNKDGLVFIYGGDINE